MRWTPLLLLLVACAPLGAAGDWALPVSPHQRLLRVPVEIAWYGLVDVYRDLRIPVAREDRERWTIHSGDMPMGAVEDYVVCPSDGDPLRRDQPQSVARLRTELVPDNGFSMVRSYLSAWIVEIDPSGEFQRRECVSRGVLEDRVYTALERRGW